MASNGIIGALRVVLGADTAALEKGLKDARGSLDKFSSNLKGAGVAMAAALTTAFVGIGLAVKGTINEADKLYKMSQSIGVPIEELSKLKHAADLSGVSLESLSKGISRLNRNTLEAAQGLQTPIRAFEVLGIAFRNADGSLKTVSQMLPELAEKFSKMRDGPEKTALAMQLLGRAGAELIPMLNLGKAGLQEMMEEAEALGIVIDQRTGAAAEAFNDNLRRMRLVFDGIVVKVTAEMLPAFLKFSQVMVDAAKNSGLLKQAAEVIVSALQFMVKETLLTVVAFRQFYVETAAIFQGLIDIGGLFKRIFSKDFWLGGKAQVDEFVKEANRIGKAVAQAFEESRKMGEGAKAFIDQFYKGANDAADDLAKKPPALKNEVPVIQGNKDALDKYIDSLRKRNASMQADLQTIGLTEGAHARLKAILEAEEIAKANNITITEAMRAKLNEEADAIALTADRLEQTREKWNEFKSAVMQVRSSLENAFVDAIMQAKSFKDIIRSLISDLARMAAQQAFRSLFGGQMAWGNAAGSAFNGGTGVLAGISKLFGFAQGGSFKVGGSGGIDSQLVAFKASPNERVSITKPGQDMGGGITVVVNPVANFQAGMTPTDMASIRTMMSSWGQTVQENTISAIRGATYRDSRAFAL